MLTPLDCTGAEVPTAFPSPFDQLGPHPLAERAALILMARLGDARTSPMGALEAGKMFGVLVVRSRDGGIAFLRAFSGTLGGAFDVPGFVPPIFDREVRAAIEVPGERVVAHLTLRARAFAVSDEVSQLKSQRDALVGRHDEALRNLLEHHTANRLERRGRRAAAPATGPERDDLLHDLAQLSRRDKAQTRALEASQAEELLLVIERLRRVERRLAAHARLQRSVSRRLMQQIHDTYRITNARGETRSLRALFAPTEPPAGAGDCVAPKLLAYALANGLEPLAMAEFWWGAPPPGGARVSGAFYPACREKCGPVLPFLLEGLAVSPPREFSPPDASALDLPILYEDEWLVVVDKPPGLLSVPPRSGTHDSVVARLQRLYPVAILVHRLDLDTSGVLVAARDAESYAALQRQFLRRTVEKEYVAVVGGPLPAEEGSIDLAIRVDVHDRPRHIHDPVHGRRAITRWRAIRQSADGTSTRVALYPLTGRTHQLRVHASHPLGLGAAIVGDRLYGLEGERLMLHAARLTLDHPANGRRLTFESPAPF